MTATRTERVAKARSKVLEAGGRRVNTVMLKPEAAGALARLLAANYAPSPTAAIARALVEAEKFWLVD